MSIKTEIEWFECDKKLPEKNFLFCFIILKSEVWQPILVTTYVENSFIGFHDDSYNLNEIKYWAYLPEIPEFE
jgi:hypothetical protein